MYKKLIQKNFFLVCGLMFAFLLEQISDLHCMELPIRRTTARLCGKVNEPHGHSCIKFLPFKAPSLNTPISELRKLQRKMKEASKKTEIHPHLLRRYSAEHGLGKMFKYIPDPLPDSLDILSSLDKYSKCIDGRNTLLVRLSVIGSENFPPYLYGCFVSGQRSFIAGNTTGKSKDFLTTDFISSLLKKIIYGKDQ